MDVSLDRWIQISVSGDLRDKLVVEVRVDELPFQKLAVWKVLTDGSHTIEWFQKSLSGVALLLHIVSIVSFLN